MGVVIGHSIGTEKGRVKNILDRTQAISEQIRDKQAKILDIDFLIERVSDNQLRIDIAGCETLMFDFNSFKVYQKEEENENFSYAAGSLRDTFSKTVLLSGEDEHIKSFPEQELYWCVDFCKTQFSKNLVIHKWIADIIRSVAMYSKYSKVYDEGDYYHTGNISDADEAIKENGKLIDSMCDTLKNLGYNIKKENE